MIRLNVIFRVYRLQHTAFDLILLKNNVHFLYTILQDYQCKCQHNTCGALCDQCCPMYNQKRWRPGKFITGHECELCQCFGHVNECFFDPQVKITVKYYPNAKEAKPPNAPEPLASTKRSLKQICIIAP